MRLPISSAPSGRRPERRLALHEPDGCDAISGVATIRTRGRRRRNQPAQGQCFNVIAEPVLSDELRRLARLIKALTEFAEFAGRHAPVPIFIDLVELLAHPMSAAQLRKVALDEAGMSRATFFRLFAEAKTSGAIAPAKDHKWKRK